MKRQLRIAGSLAATLALSSAVAGCGGEVVGIGNSGNRIGESDVVARELAEILGENPVIPEITDETLGEIFDAILANARAGHP